MGPMNNRKNKLSGKKCWLFKPMPNTTLKLIQVHLIFFFSNKTYHYLKYKFFCHSSKKKKKIKNLLNLFN